MRRAIFILALGALFVTPWAAAQSGGEIVRVGPKANGTTIRLRPTDQLVVSLPGNATTGYSWRIQSVDQTVLKHVGTRYIPKKPIRVGSGGTYVLRFRAGFSGVTTLKLVYKQAGRSAKVAKRFTLAVSVKGFPTV
jgi:inhibitor of cysteine peptidase